MKQILLLLADPDTRSTLHSWLSTRYNVIAPDIQTQFPESDQYDLLVVDHAAMHQFGAWIHDLKNAEMPELLPVLYVAPGGTLDSVDHAVWYHVEDVLSLPLEQIAAYLRVAALLRIRALSQQLRANRDKLLRVSKAIESTSDAVSIADIDGTTIYHNQAFVNLYGFTANELNVHGIPNSLFLHPQVAEEVFQAVQQGHPWRGEVELRDKYGKVIPTLLHADLIDDDDGNRIGLISVFTDITERKHAEALTRSQRIWAEALRDTAATLTSTLDLDEVLERILINIGRVVPHQFAYVMLVDDNGEEAFVVRRHGFEYLDVDDWLSSQRQAIGREPVLQQMVTTGEPVLVSAIPAEWYAARPAGMRQIQSYISAPIRLNRATIGFLYLFSTEVNFFTMTHAERLGAFAEQAAIAIQNARLHEKAQALAMLQERQRLARDLHDAVSQTLFSASVIAESLPRLWESEPQKIGSRLDQLLRLTRGAMAEMRTLLLELRPSTLTEADLDELLRHLTDALQGHSNVEVTLTVQGYRRLPADVQTVFYYVAQEALNNIVKHAHAAHVDIRLESRPDRVGLMISDNGQGFDAHTVSTTSMGLGIMHERAETIGATLNVSSQPGQGTQLTLVWTDTEQ